MPCIFPNAVSRDIDDGCIFIARYIYLQCGIGVRPTLILNADREHFVLQVGIIVKMLQQVWPGEGIDIVAIQF